MSARFRSGLLLSVFTLGCGAPKALAQVTLPEVVVSAPSPIQRNAAPATSGDGAFLQGTLPVVTDQLLGVLRQWLHR